MQPGVSLMSPDARNGMSKPERNGIRVGQLDLIQTPARAEDSQIRNHAAARADERDRFLRGKLSIHVKRLVRAQLATFAKKNFHRFRREVAMPRADVDDERTLPAGRARQGLAKLGVNRLSNHVFDDGAMWCWCGNSGHKL